MAGEWSKKVAETIPIENSPTHYQISELFKLPVVS